MLSSALVHAILLVEYTLQGPPNTLARRTQAVTQHCYHSHHKAQRMSNVLVHRWNIKLRKCIVKWVLLALPVYYIRAVEIAFPRRKTPYLLSLKPTVEHSRQDDPLYSRRCWSFSRLVMQVSYVMWYPVTQRQLWRFALRNEVTVMCVSCELFQRVQHTQRAHTHRKFQQRVSKV
jgi:hypothetical protein